MKVASNFSLFKSCSFVNKCISNTYSRLKIFSNPSFIDQLMRVRLLILVISFTLFCIKGFAESYGSQFSPGTGVLHVDVGIGESEKVVEIFYYKPVEFNQDSNIIMVIPGAGRNADDYRDSWIDSADKYNLLVLSPRYPATNYDFAAYHLGGVVKDLELINPKVERINGRISKYRMRDEDILFSFVEEPSDYLFGDFDKIFDWAKAATNSNQEYYDLFGHSAGGQILHRYILFNPASQARHVIAANSGFYTLPGDPYHFPFGLGGTKIKGGDLVSSFSSSLIVMVGEEDNVNETRGTMLHTPIADEQGLGRLERGNYFFEKSRAHAEAIGSPFNWQFEVIPNVGHEYREMGKAAADYLYSEAVRSN